jgi:uncharacterized membrane protein
MNQSVGDFANGLSNQVGNMSSNLISLFPSFLAIYSVYVLFDLMTSFAYSYAGHNRYSYYRENTFTKKLIGHFIFLGLVLFLVVPYFNGISASNMSAFSTIINDVKSFAEV